MRKTLPKFICKSIRKLLDKYDEFHDDSGTPYDYASLKTHILQLELEQEIAVLRAMLDDPKSFAQKFKERCDWRKQARKTHSIPLSDLPETPTNQLYWKIAQQVFRPKTMQAMLGIVMPQIQFCVTSELTTPTTGNSLKERVSQVMPVINLELSLDKLTSHPDIKLVSAYIFSGAWLFNLENISNFTLRLHNELEKQLRNKYAPLCEKIYSHNPQLQTLAADIQLYNENGVTPKAAIELLIRGLIMGGSSISGKDEATDAAKEAYKRFFAYFNALPVEIQRELRDLNDGSNKSLGNLIDIEIARGECVETTASYLKNILGHNSNNPLLSSPPKMSAVHLRKLENKYKANNDASTAILDTRKDHQFIQTFPEQLTRKAIEHINPKKIEDLIFLILNFPPQFYNNLWAHITLRHPNKILKRLAKAIKADFFNNEQRQALASAIYNNYDRFNLSEGIIFWAKRTGDPKIIETILRCHPEYKWPDLISATDKENNTIVSIIARKSNCKLLKIMLESIPSEKRLALLIKPNKNGKTALNHALYHHKTLATIFSALSAPDKKKIAQMLDVNADSLLHIIAKNGLSKSMRVMLESQDTSDIASFLHKYDRFGYTVFDYCTKNQKCLSVALTYLPTRQLASILESYNRNGMTSLRLAMAQDIARVKLILEHLLPEHRLQVVNMPDTAGKTIVHYAADNLEKIKTILETLRKKDRLLAITLTDQKNTTAAKIAFDDTEILQTILTLLPRKDRKTALDKVTPGLSSSILHNSAKHRNDDLFIFLLLKLYRRSERLTQLLCKQNERTALDYLIDDNERLSDRILALLRALPQNDHLALLKSTANNKIMLDTLRYMLYLPEKYITDKFRNSFTFIFIKIYFLISEKATGTSSPYLFAPPKNSADKLKEKIMQLSSFAEIRKYLEKYIEQNPQEQLAKELSALITPATKTIQDYHSLSITSNATITR